MALTRIFDVSNRSLATYRNALDVTAHNIANASNPNFSRQRVDFATERPDMQGGLRLGAGVKLTDIHRIKDAYIDRQIFEKNTEHEYNSKKADILGQVEELFLEPSEAGFSNVLSEFFGSWQELSSNPTSVGLRNNVINATKTLSARANDVTSGFDEMKTSLVSEFRDNVNVLNQNLENLQKVNVEIKSQLGQNGQYSDILDERDRIIEEISKLANIKVEIGDDELARISVGGMTGVTPGDATEFKVSISDGELGIFIEEEGNSARLNGGKLAGIAEVYGTIIPKAQDQFVAIVETLKEHVNGLHEVGYTDTNPPQTGYQYFLEEPEGELIINPMIEDNLDLLSASADGTNGNSDIAISISEIFDKEFMNGDDLTSNYSQIISLVGSEKKLADNMVVANSMSLEQLDARKKDVSGVSIDEEMTNILQYQRSYDASAKLIKVADEMIQTILQLV